MEAPGKSHQAPSMVTRRLLGIMELWLAHTFLPLLLLSWLPVGMVSEELGEPVTTVQFEICLENLTVPLLQVKWYRPVCLEGEIQANTLVLRESGMNFTSSSLCAAHKGICVCRVFITSANSTDTGNSTRAVLSCGSAGLQTDDTGFNLLLPILLGLVVGTLLYMPVIGILLWQCRRNRTGELMSGEVAEGNQISTAAPVTGTEDLTYANLNFEKKGTRSASSNVIYTEIKPSQQQQSGGDGRAASTKVDVSPKEKGK